MKCGARFAGLMSENAGTVGFEVMDLLGQKQLNVDGFKRGCRGTLYEKEMLMTSRIGHITCLGSVDFKAGTREKNP